MKIGDCGIFQNQKSSGMAELKKDYNLKQKFIEKIVDGL